ncbi:MAG: hypothetical protein K8T91_22200 [Planctomycetes bacterium]|nr:hypothetical protein [Planctomycetota bacterium]
MPDFSHVQPRHLPCPQCLSGLIRDNLVGFQWGYCYGSPGTAYANYQVGDSIQWRADKRGNLPAWSYFRGGGGNIGDPHYENVFVRESEWDVRRCSSCGHSFAGIALRIEKGIIHDVRVYADGLPDAEISIIEDDGSLRPMPEWDDYPMPNIVNGGLRERLIPIRRK